MKHLCPYFLMMALLSLTHAEAQTSERYRLQLGAGVTSRKVNIRAESAQRVCLSTSNAELKWHNFITLSGRSIASDPSRENILWIAGPGGLIRYNTALKTWKSFTTAEGLSKVWAKSVAADKNFIWVGTESGGANMFDVSTERFTPFLQLPYSPRDSTDYPTVYVIYPEQDFVWVGTDRGLYMISRISLDTLRLFTTADGLGDNYVHSIVDDGQYLWLATAYGGAFIPENPPVGGGISRLNKVTHEIQNFRVHPGPYVNMFSSMAGTGDTLWVASSAQLFVFDKNTQSFSTVLGNMIQSPSSVIADQQDVWCLSGSTDGKWRLFRIDRHNATLKDSVTLPDKPSGGTIAISGPDIYVSLGERFYVAPKSSLQLTEIKAPLLPSQYWYALGGTSQQIYAGSASDLVTINQKDLSISRIATVPGTGGIIRGITLDGVNLWVGTNNGLFQYKLDDTSFVKSYLSSLIVFSSVVDGKYVWASTHLGLYRIDTLTGQIALKDLTSELNTFGAPRIYSLVLDGDVLWLSFSGKEQGGGLVSGVVKLNRTTMTTLAIKKFPITDYTQEIETLIDQGTYLLAGGNEISKISKDGLIVEPLIPQKAGKMVLSGSLLWVIVPNQGAKVFDLETGKEKLYVSESNGLVHDWVTDMYVSDTYAWFSTYGGISALEISSVTTASNKEVSSPTSFALFQNYPNPFNPSTTIRYGLPSRSNVRIVITNTLGQQIAVLENRELEAGYHEFHWNANVASGVYFYRIDAVSVSDPNNRFLQVKKMLLLK